MADKIFCGSGKEFITQYGKLLKVSYSRSDLQKMIDYMDSEKSEWVNLVMKEKKEKVEGKPTHYFEIDTYKSENKQKVETVVAEVIPQTNSEEVSDDLPF